ncbi:hypothetical protein PF010_g16514 [Phytophthora fragariae]|uniref:Casein kinase substrate phosphoprotein PP28 domain-containing protein n=1 Tax=Phytophthora fragariae TaxID=53985 RepID=A0A6G0KRJ6_9STRA|nr:hypothetical protein PF010_g16514 [Phytophthora fragariae]
MVARGRRAGYLNYSLLQDIDDALGNDSASEDGDEPDTQRESDEEDDDSADLEEQGVINRRSPLLRDREEREQVRKDEAMAFEARQHARLELARQDREDQLKREAAAADEARRRHEERMDRDRADAKQRNEEMLLLLSAMQQNKSK